MKRLLVFALLLAIGFIVLRFAIGDEDVVAGNVGNAGRPEPPQQQPTAPSGVGLQPETRGVTLTQDGPLEFSQTKTLPPVDGRSRIENVYTLKAGDSRPIAAGQQQLDDVAVQIFDRGSPSAKLTCKRAFVTLRPDVTGRPSLDEGKDLDLRDAVIESLPGSRLAGLRLELATARVRIEPDALVLTTPRDEPVLLVLDGEQRLTLRGLGAQAMLPRHRDGALRRADIEILRQPVLTSDGLTVRADGRLHFVEELDAGVGTITINDAVAMDVTRADLRLPGAVPGAAAASGGATVRGDQFLGWLLRVRDRGDDGQERQRLDWRQLVLTGAPATIAIPGSQLSTPRVTVMPGLFGAPVLLTAHGGESRLEQTALRPGSRQKHLLLGTSSRRLHYVMPKEQLGALHRSFGFPRWSLRQLDKLQVVVAEGSARVQNGPASYEASEGVRLYRREDLATGIVRGLGRIRVEQRAETAREQDLFASGSDGFVLRATPAGDVLQLGPPLPADPDAPGPWREHEFEVRYGDAVVRGRGVGEVQRQELPVSDRGAGPPPPTVSDVRIHFVSPDARITMKVPRDGLELQRVRSLRGHFVDRAPLELDAAGWPLQVALARGDDAISATAPRLVQIGPRSLRLLPADGADATTWSGLAAVDGMPRLQQNRAAGRHTGSQQIDVRGPMIDVHHVGGDLVIVDAVAVGDELPHVYARIATRSDREATTIACAAERLRVLPFVLSPDAQRWLTADAGFAFAFVTFHGLSKPWLVVDRVRDFQLDDPEQGHVEGRGRTLLVSQAGRAALFVGDPEALTPAEVTRTHEGRTTNLRGARVRVFENDGAQLQALGAFADRSAFLAPTMTLHEARATGLLAHMQATCRGNIEVRPEEVVFGGPVQAQGLRADGSLDPNGIAIDANELHMVRQRATGRVLTVTGKQVVVDWTRVHARCAQVELDVDRQRLVASDPDEAQVVLGDGHELFSRRIEVDYHTLAFTMSSGRSSWRAPLARKK